MMLYLFLVSWGAYAQHDKMVMFKDKKVGAAYDQYIRLKDAFVASNADEAKKAAVDLQKLLGSLNNGKKAAEEAAKIESSSDIKEQRKAFGALSDEVSTLVKNEKLSGGIIYLEYCPMANGGSYWLSNEKEIKNPYFGDRMLKCGSVKETIQ